MKAYKVVIRSPDGRLWSAVASGKARIQYLPGQWVEAPQWLGEKGYHLFVFEELSAALKWLELFASAAEAWEAEAEDVLPLPAFLSLDAIREGQVVPSLYGKHLAKTMMARRVKLVRRVAVVEGGKVREEFEE